MRKFKTLFLEDVIDFFEELTINKMAIKTYSLDEVKDRFVGEQGTVKREKYEYELQMELIGEMIKKARLERQLTQEELGKMIGVQKAQISKLENSTNSATISTILRVFKALSVNVHFNVTMNGQTLELV
jgi:DNA-binding XRE family transcriptional regulator